MAVKPTKPAVPPTAPTAKPKASVTKLPTPPEAPAKASVAKAKTTTVPAKSKTVAAKPKAVIENVLETTSHYIENLDKDSAEALLVQLQEDGEFNLFKQGGVLSTIQTNGWYTEHGFESFKDYVETVHGIQYRKAMYLINIYNNLVESGVPWEAVAHLGWTKLKELAPVMNTENYEEWVEAAEDMTVMALVEYIKQRSKGELEAGETTSDADAKATASKTSTMTFKVHEDQKEIIRDAVDKAKHEADTEVDAVALEAVCMSYLNGGSAAPAKKQSLKTVMKGKTWEEVLEVFSQLWPDINLTVEFDGEEEDPEETTDEEDEEV